MFDREGAKKMRQENCTALYRDLFVAFDLWLRIVDC
jgi:hypothetical protein